MNLPDSARKLQRQVEIALDSFAEAKELKALIFEQLAHDGRGVSVENNPHLPFFLLPVTICGALGRDPEPAFRAAAAIQFFMAAGDILDDVEDNDSETSLCARCGTALAINAATALIFLAEKTLAHLNGDLAENTVKHIIETTNYHFLKACGGQHLDLSIPRGKLISESAYLKIAGLKSASPIENSCRIGAILGGANAITVARFAKFGYYLGMSAQMNNDIKGVNSLKDIQARKVTLPFIFALRYADRTSKNTLNEYLDENFKTHLGPPEIYQVLLNCGAIQYTMIRSETFKQLAKEKLFLIRRTGTPTKELESLLN